MAGIWERINATAADRVPVHLLEAMVVLRATDAFTKAQLVAALNARLRAPLAVSEETDCNALIDQLDAQSTTLLKLVYLEKIRAWGIAAEMGRVTEAQFRTGLSI